MIRVLPNPATLLNEEAEPEDVGEAGFAATAWEGEPYGAGEAGRVIEGESQQEYVPDSEPGAYQSGPMTQVIPSLEQGFGRMRGFQLPWMKRTMQWQKWHYRDSNEPHRALLTTVNNNRRSGNHPTGANLFQRRPAWYRHNRTVSVRSAGSAVPLTAEPSMEPYDLGSVEPL